LHTFQTLIRTSKATPKKTWFKWNLAGHLKATTYIFKKKTVDDNKDR